jgi:glycosyltransferase involved in cell wall biosynthesis
MKISVVIPVYNKADYIDGCLDSLLQQDFDSFEVICVCDGSTDNSGEICDQWAAKDQRIRVIHKDNSGVTAARRRGVEEAKGKYLMFVDADDKLLPGALTTMHQAIEQSQADEVIATFTTHDGVASPVVYKGFTPVEPLIKSIITSKNRFPVLWGIIFRRELLNDVLDIPREIIEGEDKLMQVKVLMKQPKVFFIPQPVYCYTLGLPNSRRHTLEREQLYDQLLLQALGRWATDFSDTLTLHKLKEYERFIYDGVYDVRKAYYKSAIGKPSSSIPLYDRLVFALPPVLARPVIRLYRKIITIKQNGL